MADDFLYLEVIGEREAVRNLDLMPETVRVVLSKKADAWLDRLIDKVKENIRTRFKNRSGRLETAVDGVVVDNGYEVDARVFIEGVPYARAQEEGGFTPPHVIQARNRKVMAFYGALGDKVFATKVLHPGARIEGRHYMKDAYREMGPEISRGIKKAIVEGIRQNMRNS